jgi:hypothetical protein
MWKTLSSFWAQMGPFAYILPPETAHIQCGATGLPFDVADRGGKAGLSKRLQPIRTIDKLLVKIRPQLFAYQFIYELKR